jgi:DNA mismatch endonuclease, patch repair protein
MARVKTRNTAPEVALRSALWAAGVRGWRLHKRLPGRPDLVWQSRRVAVFVDGAFWHGHPDYYHGQSGAFWDEKIARNRERDRRVNEELAALGYRVVRIWDFEVEKHPGACVGRVREALEAAAAAPGRSGEWGVNCQAEPMSTNPEDVRASS